MISSEFLRSNRYLGYVDLCAHFIIVLLRRIYTTTIMIAPKWATSVT